MDRFTAVSPLDYRYYGGDEAMFERLSPFVSEEAWVRYQARVESALTDTFADLGLCSRDAAEEVQRACDRVTAEQVYELDVVLAHSSRALVEAIRGGVSDEAKPFVHLFATSFDILDTSTSLRFQEVVREVLLPDLGALVKTIAQFAKQRARTVQIGRTHGVHAEPITFGLFLAVYVSRLAGRALAIERARQDLRGKLSGAVGAHNALALRFPKSSHLVERLFLARLGLLPSDSYTSTQIVEAEFVTDLMHSFYSCFSVLGNLADDIRHLHRTEIGEVMEPKGKKGIGSSTMPHKTNPKSFENIKSLFKAFAPRMVTQYLDQICEHQRDLSNSASGRFSLETLVALDYAVVRMKRALEKLVVNEHAMATNLELSKGYITAEPMYILLSMAGVPDAYQKAKELAQAASEQDRTVLELARSVEPIREAMESMSQVNLEMLNDPTRYTGDAPVRVQATCSLWGQRMDGLLSYLKKEKRAISRPPARWLKRLVKAIHDAEAGKSEPEQWLPQTRRQMIEEWF